MVIPPGVKRTSILGATSVGQLVKIVYGERGKEEQYVPTDEQLANFNNLGERVGKIIADEGQDLRTVMGYWGQLETIGDSYIKNGGRNLEILWCPADADYATRNYVDRADEIARRHGEKEKLIETWKILTKKSEKLGYKPTEATEKQRDYITELSKFLDRRDASTLIALLQILNNQKKE